MESEGHIAVIDYDKFRNTFGSVEKLLDNQ